MGKTDGQGDEFVTEVKRPVVFCPVVIIVELSRQLLGTPPGIAGPIPRTQFMGEIHLPLSKSIEDPLKPAPLANFIRNGSNARRPALVKFGPGYGVQQRAESDQSEFFMNNGHKRRSVVGQSLTLRRLQQGELLCKYCVRQRFQRVGDQISSRLRVGRKLVFL